MPTRSHAIDQLQSEWNRLRHDRTALATAAGWRIVDTTFEQLTSLDQVLAAIGFREVPRRAHEDALRQLVQLAADDPLAARVVVQRLLPPALSVVAKRRAAGAGAATADEMLGALWIAICTFSPTRRPACLAAALVDDADYVAFRKATRAKSSAELPTGQFDDRVANDTSITAGDELAALLVDAESNGALSAADADLLRRVVSMPGTDEVARSLSVSARTVRLRRAQATQRLRRAVAA